MIGTKIRKLVLSSVLAVLSTILISAGAGCHAHGGFDTYGYSPGYVQTDYVVVGD